MTYANRQLLGFRHSVRSELNQILGYSELLAQDQADLLSEANIRSLTQLQQASKQILEALQMLLSGQEALVFGLSYRSHRSLAAPLTDIGRLLAQLLNELPTQFIPDVKSMQAALLCLHQLLDNPLERQRPAADAPKSGKVDINHPYTAAIPLDLQLAGRLLVVDDSEANRQLIERQLKELGIEVTTVSDGQSALNALKEKTYDCILLDMVLPGMDGPSILRAIRDQPEQSGIPILMLSSLDESSEAARCIQIGAEDYLLRPIDLILLRAKLHSTIQRKSLYHECQQAGKDLAARNEELKRFVAVTSHDLQAPLRTLEGNLKSIGLCIPEGFLEAQSLIADSATRCKRMHALLNDLLLYARLGQIAPFFEDLDLDWVLTEAMGNLREEIEATGAQIHTRNLPRVKADFKQMLYLFQNLLSNSIRYRSDLKPQIEISAEEHSEDLVLTITDNGQGIPGDQHARIFEPFHRLHGDDIPGTGLGLAIARRAAELAHGKLWVSSTPGVGSTFFLSLPRISSPSEDSSACGTCKT